MSVEKDFKVLIDKYDFKYEFNSFLSFYDFSGPFYAYSFHNDSGCFTILYALQRNEIEYYISKEFSNKQETLLKINISEQVFKALKCFRKKPSNWFKRDNVLLIDYIVDEINTKGEFFDIKVHHKYTKNA